MPQRRYISHDRVVSTASCQGCPEEELVSYHCRGAHARGTACSAGGGPPGRPTGRRVEPSLGEGMRKNLQGQNQAAERPRGAWGWGHGTNSPLSTQQEAGAGRAFVPVRPSFTTPGFLQLLPTTPCSPVSSVSTVSSLRPLDVTVWVSRCDCGPCSARSWTELYF